MSLDWQATDIPEHLRNWTTRSPEGKEDTQMHPLMHRIIWLTMILGGSPSDLKESDLHARLAVINRLDPDMLKMTFGAALTDWKVRQPQDDGDEWLTLEEYFHRLQVPYIVNRDDDCRPTLHLTPSVISRLYGTLWTNADRRPFATWRKRYCENVLSRVAYEYRSHLTHLAEQANETYALSQPEADPHNAPTL